MKLFGFVAMPNHLHLIAAAGDKLHAVIRDFKRFTSRTIHDRLGQDGRQTLLGWLADATQSPRRRRSELGLWQDRFHPQAIHSPAVFEQKLGYLLENPVRKGLVQNPADWWYSSAGFYQGRKNSCMKMDLVEL